MGTALMGAEPRRSAPGRSMACLPVVVMRWTAHVADYTPGRMTWMIGC
jgi:hypothetical protein